MRLKLGKMTPQEIASWFGIVKKTYSNNTVKYLNLLKTYCEYERVYGGIIVKEIYIDEYVKNLKDDDKLYIEQLKLTFKEDAYISTIAGMARRLQRDYPEYASLNFDSLRRRLSNAAERLFGKTVVKNKEENPGPCGSRKYVWAVKLDDYNNYRFKTKQEEEIYQSILTKATKARDLAQDWENLALLQAALKKGDITQNEYNVQMTLGQDFYTDVIVPFEITTGVKLVHATQHEVIESQIEQLLKAEFNK